MHKVEVREKPLLSPELVDQATESIRLIRDRIKTAQYHQQKYYNREHKAVEFHIREFIFVKVKPMKGISKFNQGNKLSLRYIRLIEIIERINNIAYKLAPLIELPVIHIISTFQC